MRWHPWILVLAIFLLLYGRGFNEEVRTWTSSDGKTIEARFIAATETEVTIQRVRDGRRFTFPLTRLDEADRRWLAERAAGPHSRPLRPEEIAELTKIPDDAEGAIRLPLRIHIIGDIELEQKGVKMSTWVTREDVLDILLPEVNRIWSAAGTEWAIESIVERPAADVPDREAAIIYIQSAKRNAEGKSDPARMPKIHAFCDKDNRHPAINNLYLFPYLGQTSQGNAALGGNYAVVGVWTDKPTGASRPPEKFVLAEKGEFETGSIGRTCAHELGHNLALVHPDRAIQTRFGRVMGGRNPGYEFTAEEIELARKTAIRRANKVLEWVSNQDSN